MRKLKIIEHMSLDGVIQHSADDGDFPAVTADQVAEYAHHGYAVVAIGLKGQLQSGLHGRRLTSLLRQRNSALPLRHVIDPKVDAGEEARRLAAFLDSHDIPEDEKRRSRV